MIPSPHRLGHKPIIDVNPRRSVDMKEALKQEKKARRTSVSSFPKSVATSSVQEHEFAAPCPRARVRQGSRPPHVWHDRSDGQPTDAPYRSADLVRLVSFAITVAASRKTVRPRARSRRKYRIGGCANADPTMVAIKIAPIAVRGRRCSLGVLARSESISKRLIRHMKAPPVTARRAAWPRYRGRGPVPGARPAPRFARQESRAASHDRPGSGA